MRILVITDYLRTPSFNGSEIFCTELIRALQRQHEIDVIARRPGKGVLGPEVTFVIETEIFADSERLGEFLAAHIDLSAYDLIYNLGALTFGCAVVSQLPPLSRQVPLVNHFQALLGPYARFEKLNKAEQLASGASQIEAAGRAALNIFISQSEFRLALQFGFKLDKSLVSVIPNGLPAEHFAAIQPDGSFFDNALANSKERPIVITTAGRFSDYVKGADLVYRAFAQLYQERKDVFLISIGNSDRFAYLLRELPSDSYRVSDWLPRAEFLRVLALSDFLVLPSRYEPFGLIALEAMFLGVPVIANAVGGLAESIHHEKFGLLNAPKNGSLGLFLAMKQLAAVREQLKKIGSRGQAYVQKEYSLERICDLVERDFRRVVLAEQALAGC
ncbi:MAG TPA: glycosyltransferase family 4 protein [Pyrinomonadaceae bacterium]|jgi:glycosyltransferase involved in cell wall biosynthesis|nr:glycosyltransferase family 4 protein [Pyrinomonadaceae bacterium]